jgi:hypothetical protein
MARLSYGPTTLGKTENILAERGAFDGLQE